MHIGREDRVFLVAVRLALLPQADDLAQGLDVEADGLGFQELVANIAGKRLLFLLQPLDLLDKLAQLVLRRNLKCRHMDYPTFARSTPPDAATDSYARDTMDCGP